MTAAHQALLDDAIKTGYLFFIVQPHAFEQEVYIGEKIEVLQNLQARMARFPTIRRVWLQSVDHLEIDADDVEYMLENFEALFPRAW